jgi:uncharacterized protein (DUF433 family)
METILSINLITSNPNVRGGRPCIAGTGVRVSDVAMVMLFHTPDPGEIAAWFGLPLAQIQQITTAEELKEKRIGSRGDPLLPR